MMTSLRMVIASLLLLLPLCPLTTMAQDAPKTFKPEELEQLAAPIALHPDPLLAQVLMASTYPLEVVQAARFVKENTNLKGDQLNEALKQYSWDDSVKSLVTFPQVITMMNDKLDWLQKLGDAFLGQQQDLMAAIQRLRARAQAQGQLKSTPEQNVIVEPAAAVPSPPPGPAPGAPPPASAPAAPAPIAAQPAPPPMVQAPPAPAAAPTTVQVQQAPATVQVVQAPPTIIKIEPANPQVVAVPAYDPVAVYGAWPYPAYPPYYPYPPGYFAAGAMMFGAGVAVGAALWSDCDWNGGDVDINNNVANNFSNNVNNSNTAKARVEQRQNSGNRQNTAGSGAGGQNRGKWQHNPEHRKGVQYRDTATQQRFNKTGPANAQSREAFRGRTGEQGVGRAAQQGGVGQQGPRAAQQGRVGQQGPRAEQSGLSADRGGAAGDRGGAQASPRTGGFGQGGGGQGRQAGAFEGMGSGRDAKSFSDRGHASRESFSRSSAGGGGGGRAGGGGGGGGGRGGGGGGGRGGGRR